MKKLLVITGLSLALAACSGEKTATPDISTKGSKAAQASVPVVATKTKAVLIYADWCGSCKVLDPAVKKAQSLGPIAGVEFVTLDYTSKDTQLFYEQAEAAGVSEAVTDYLDGTIKTGQLLLVDLDDQKVLRSVKKDMNAMQILQSLKDAVSAS